MTCQSDTLQKAVRVLLPLEFHPDSSVCIRKFYSSFIVGPLVENDVQINKKSSNFC